MKINLSDYRPCRLDNDKTLGRGLWFLGQHYSIDINADFAKKHNLDRIAQVISHNGHTFDVFRGFGYSRLGTWMEFACAVYTGQIH